MNDGVKQKLDFQARGQFAAILNVFNCYGLQDFIEPSIQRCLEVCQRYARNYSGDEIPMNVMNELHRRGTD